MNPLTWLLAKLRRSPTPSALTPQALTLPPASVSLPAPPTEGERTVRAVQREQVFRLRLAEEVGRASEPEHDMSNLLPAHLLRLVSQLRYNAADQEHARRWGDWAEELRLIIEAHELEAVAKFQFWQHGLYEQFGRSIGAKLSQGQIELGMTLNMVLAVLGEPKEAERGLTMRLDDPTLCILRYGSDATGSVIELRDGVVVRAQLGTVTFADYVYELPDISGC
jgi:hypothetical protein